MNYIINGIVLVIGMLFGVMLVTWLTVMPQHEVGPQLIAYTAGTVIALCALGLTIWQAHSTNLHNKLSVVPHLLMGSSLRADPFSLKINIHNTGLGPAFITDASIYFQGQELNGPQTMVMQTVTQKILEPYTQVGGHFSVVDSTSVVRHGEIMNISDQPISIDSGHEQALLETVNAGRKLARFVIKYRSIYGDEYTLDEFLDNPN